MINPTLDDIKRPNGKYPAFSMVGGYSLYYATERGTVVCATCINDTEGTYVTEDYPENNIVKCDIHWEGDNLECVCCGSYIEPSYGETT